MDDLAIVVITPLIFLCCLALIGVGYWYFRRTSQRKELIERIEGSDAVPGGIQEDTSGKKSPSEWYMAMTGGLGNLIKSRDEGDITALNRRFVQAGIRHRNAIVVFLGSKIFLAILFPLVFSLVRVFIIRSMLPLYLAVILVVLALIGFYLPELWLRVRTARRKEEISRYFPDALDLMVVCAEAGMGLDSAVARVGEEIKISSRHLGDEFRLLILETRAGKMRREALRNLALRTDVEDIGSFATLLIQTDKFGTSVAQALRVQADSMRTKRHQRVEELAAKLPVKLLFPTIFFIFPALFVVLMGPAIIQAFRMWSGR
jgi:tight adherence protein C